MTDNPTNQEQKTEIAVQQQGALLPVGMDLAALQADAGAGTQNVTTNDIATPIIGILQANSPQCKRSDGKYVNGAREGFLYNNVTNEIHDGDAGIVVIPCFFEKVFLEWKPERGGFAGIHPANTPLKDQVKEYTNNEGKVIRQLPNGNTLQETNQHYVLVLKEDGTYYPAVISMFSTGLKSSRQWNSLIKQVTLKAPNGAVFNPASYYMTYKLKTIPRTKDSYSWFGWSISPIAPVPSAEIYNAARMFEQAIASGSIKVKQEQQEEAPVVVAEEDIPFDA